MPEDSTVGSGGAPAPVRPVCVGTLELAGWGRFSVAWSGDELWMLGLPDRAPGEHMGRLAARDVIVERTSAVPENFRLAIEAYFAGDPGPLASTPVGSNGTSFQRAVWAALREVPLGRTVSYGVLAKGLGTPAATRAVGNACGANLIAIAVPCHRIIQGSGGIGGFAAGVGWKQRLLEHELRIAARRGAA